MDEALKEALLALVKDLRKSANEGVYAYDAEEGAYFNGRSAGLESAAYQIEDLVNAHG
jgi:hypothetical protein